MSDFEDFGQTYADQWRPPVHEAVRIMRQHRDHPGACRNGVRRALKLAGASKSNAEQLLVLGGVHELVIAAQKHCREEAIVALALGGIAGVLAQVEMVEGEDAEDPRAAAWHVGELAAKTVIPLMRAHKKVPGVMAAGSLLLATLGERVCAEERLEVLKSAFVECGHNETVREHACLALIHDSSSRLALAPEVAHLYAKYGGKRGKNLDIVGGWNAAENGQV